MDAALLVRRYPYEARASADRNPLSVPDRTSLAQLDSERRSTKPEVARSSRARGANNGCVAERPIAAACKAVSTRTRWFESIRTHQHDRASSTGRAAASKAEGSRSIPWSGARYLDVAKWPKASDCKPDGASPRPFESDRRVQGSLAQWTRAAGFYPAGRPFESVTRHRFISPIAQMAERLAVNQEVRGSKPRRGASSV